MSDDGWLSTASIGFTGPATGVRVKVCGITTVHDAELAATAGADAIGMIFSSSPRQIDAERARSITRALPPFVTPVGVFVNATADEIKRTCDASGIRAVQLHGTEAPGILDELHAFTVFKAFRIADAATISGVRLWLDRAPYWPHALVFDSFNRLVAGGTGEQFDWSLIPPAEVRGDKPALILAGGLRPDNVAAAITEVKPYAVDVSSGIEKEPGHKDPDKLLRFVEAAKTMVM